MKILISPTKTMLDQTESEPYTLPFFIDEAKVLNKMLMSLKLSELMEAMKINDKLMKETLNNIQNIKFDTNGLSAIEAFDGLQYKRLAYKTLLNREKEYINRNVLIFSGLYGLLRPSDSIYKHRLDFNMKFDLYEFWGDKLAKFCRDNVVYDLASNEFSKAISKYLPKDKYFKIKFMEKRDDKLKSFSTHSKIERGLFLRWLAKKNVSKLEDLIKYEDNGYKFIGSLTHKNEIIFVKGEL